MARLWCFVKLLVVLCGGISRFGKFIGSPFKYNVIETLRRLHLSNLMELCTTPQFAMLFVSRWTRNTPTFAVCRNVRKLEHFTQPIKYSQKNCNPSSCVAQRPKLTVACGQITNFLSCIARRPLCHLIMACDQITNFPSYVARRLLSHLIMTCDQNTALSSDEAHICVKHFTV